MRGAWANACAQADVRLTIGFVRRFDPQWGKLKDIVQSGAVGSPVIWRFAAGGRPGRPWFRDVNKGGGPLMDGASAQLRFRLADFRPGRFGAGFFFAIRPDQRRR